MLTPSVNLVQSAFPEEKQGEISGLSRSISNLGSSFGTAIAGTILVSDLASGNGTYVASMIVLGALALIGLAVAVLLPAESGPGCHHRCRAPSPDTTGARSDSLIRRRRITYLHHPLAAQEGDRFKLIELGSGREGVLEGVGIDLLRHPGGQLRLAAPHRWPRP